MNKIDLSEQLSEEAIQYKNRYLKDVNGAFIYWQLARIYIKKKQREKAIKLLDKIDDEPDLQPSHHTFKWVYKCDACYSIKPVDTVRFMAYYAELQKAIKKYKHYADPERMADFKYADLTGNYQKMLEMARQKTSSADRLYYIALAYEKMGQTTKALDTLKAYIVKHDSLINVEALNRAETNSLELKAARADNEAQTLRYEKHRLTFIWVTIAIIALFAFFAILTWFRHRQTQRMAKVQAAQEQIQKELLIARNIQMTMVPSEFPQREGLDMYASMTPAKEVGGDLYGYLLEGDKLYFAVGDVSGKGIPASLFMAQATRLFLTLAKQGMMPDEICTRMNDALSDSDNKNSMFVTFWLGLVTLSTGHLVFCNAGHNPPVIGGGDKHGDFLDMKPNVPIGLWPGIEYEGDEIDTIKGRPLFIYTDGLNEAENPALEQFGDDKLLDILRQKDSSTAQEVVETLKAEVEKHRNGAEPNDDLTMMRIKVE